jgi:hypothetical protein
VKLQAVPAGADLPPHWSEALFDYTNPEASAFGHANYTINDATGEKSWQAYCVILFKEERLESYHPTAAEAIEAVEQFVREAWDAS